jgi:hypothetical protein
MPAASPRVCAVAPNVACLVSHWQLFWKLLRENFELVNFRRFGEQITSLRPCHQGFCHLAIEMGVAPSLVVESIEYGEG